MGRYEQERLEDWQKGKINDVDVIRYINYLEGNYARDKKRLEAMQAYVDQHYAGYDEWTDQRIIKTQQDLDQWRKWITFEQWILEQPKCFVVRQADEREEEAEDG